MQFTPDIPIRLGQVVEGKYRIERILGLGGMGVVVQATHLVLDQQVAMKFLLPAVATNEEVVRRFVREARAAIKIRSEHVARIMDVSGTDSDIPFLVMEYLHGHDLSDVLKQRGPLPVRDAVGYVLQACEALGEAHAQGIVHRDLKPANLFLSARADGTDCVKVLDFGISKLAVSGDSSLTRTKGMMGSPLYMSPEQARSARNATTRSDIWSMGIVLYELLTGRTPFKGETVMELCADLLDTTPPPPSALRPDLPEGLDAVVMKCIEKEPANRFDNVAELAAALAPFGVAGAWESARVTARVLGIRSLAKTKRVVELPPTDRCPSPLKSPWPEAPGAVSHARATDTVGSWGSTRRPLRSRSKSAAIGALLVVGSVVVILAVGGAFWWRSSSIGPSGASDEEQVGLVTSTTPPLAASIPTTEVVAPVLPMASVSAPAASSSAPPRRVVRPRTTRPARPSAASPSVPSPAPPASTSPPVVRTEPTVPPTPPATKKEAVVPKSDLDLFEDNK